MTISIDGQCHCGTLSYQLEWPDDDTRIPVRKCGCSFCVKHGAAWTSHCDAKFVARVRDEAALARHRFGTRTAEFFVCRTCGVVPFVVSEIEGCKFAVVNVNTFDEKDGFTLVMTTTNFDSEDTAARLDRRSRHWIASVLIQIADSSH